MLKSLSTAKFKWLDPAKCNLYKYDDNNSRGSTLEAHLEYSKELHEQHNYYNLLPDKLEIKREMLSDYKLKIADFNISTGKVKNQFLTSSSKKSMCFITKT